MKNRVKSHHLSVLVIVFHLLVVLFLRNTLNLEFTIPNPKKASGTSADAVDNLDFYYQLLPRDLLENRFCESLVNLHSQPPLGNMLFGILLKLFGSSATLALSTFFLLMGALNVGLVYLLVHRWTASWKIGLLAGIFWSFSPALLAFEHVPFYTVICANLLLLSTLAFNRLCAKGDNLSLLALCLSLVSLVLLRSVFHLFFALLFPFYLLLKPGRCARKNIALYLLIPVLVFGGGWYGKNLVSFGFFGSSSWSWMNLYNGLSKTQAEVMKDLFQKKEIPECIYRIRPFSSLERFKAYGFNRATKVPATNRLWKRRGYPNLNNINLIDLMPLYRDADLALLRQRPLSLFESTWKGLLLFGKSSTDYPLLRVQDRSLKPLQSLHRILHGSPLEHSRTLPAPSPFLVLFLLTIIGRTFCVFRKKRGREGGVWGGPGEGCILFLLFYTAVATSLFEYGENMRFKFMIEPLFWGYFASLVIHLLRQATGGRAKSSKSPE